MTLRAQPDVSHLRQVARLGAHDKDRMRLDNREPFHALGVALSSPFTSLPSQGKMLC